MLPESIGSGFLRPGKAAGMGARVTILEINRKRIGELRAMLAPSLDGRDDPRWADGEVGR